MQTAQYNQPNSPMHPAQCTQLNAHSSMHKTCYSELGVHSLSVRADPAAQSPLHKHVCRRMRVSVFMYLRSCFGVCLVASTCLRSPGSLVCVRLYAFARLRSQVCVRSSVFARLCLRTHVCVSVPAFAISCVRTYLRTTMFCLCEAHRVGKVKVARVQAYLCSVYTRRRTRADARKRMRIVARPLGACVRMVN